MLKRLRLSQKLTQNDVAKKLNVARTTVAMWELGKSKPRADTLIKLAKLYQCKVDDLLSE